MIFADTAHQVFKLTKKAIYSIFSFLLIPIYLTILVSTWAFTLAQTTAKDFYNFVVYGPISRLVKYIIGLVYEIFQSLKTKTQEVRPAFLRHLRSEEQMANIFHRASANPDQITENQKVLMLMQKMRKLQQTIFQQSVDRRKAEQQLFDLKVQFSQKNGILIRERSENVEIMNKLNVLKLQLAEKVELLDKSKQQVQQLSKQLQTIKTHMQQQMPASTKQQQQQVQTQNQLQKEQSNQEKEDQKVQEQSVETTENKTEETQVNNAQPSTSHKKKNKKR